MSSIDVIYSGNIANMIPESPLNKMMDDHKGGGGGGGMGTPVSSRTNKIIFQ